MRKKRKTLTVYEDEFFVLQKAKRAYERLQRKGQVRWGDFLSFLGAGYLLGVGLIKIRDLEEKLDKLKKGR